MLKLTLEVLNGLTGLAGIFIAFFAYRLTNQQRIDTWFKTLNDFHQFFWEDEDLKQVRAWIANDKLYIYINTIISKRLKGRNNILDSEYRELEKLDKFFNFLLKVYIVSQSLGKQQQLWERLYFQYWIDDIILAKRYLLWIYFQTYLNDAAKVLPVNVDYQQVKLFEKECKDRINEIQA